MNKTALKNKISNRIMKLRSMSGLTQKAVAAKLGMSDTAYGNMERGETDICITRLAQVAEVFHTDMADLLDLNEKNVNNCSGTNHSHNLQVISSSTELKELIWKNELEKCQLEISYLKEENNRLKEILDWLKAKDKSVK